MTASARAQRLINRHGTAWFQRGLYTAKKHVAETADADAALLAYVADLEACVAAARHHLTESRGPVHLIALREAEMALADCLAALDRPEDGEHGDKD